MQRETWEVIMLPVLANERPKKTCMEDGRTDSQTDGHRDSMTDLAQMAESVKIFLGPRDWGMHKF